VNKVREKNERANKTTLTFQYLSKLKINPNEKSTVEMTGSEKKGFKIKSSAYEKYHLGDKAKTLVQLISLMRELDEIAAKRLLSNDEWLGSAEVNHYFALVTSKHPDVYHIDSGHNTDMSRFLERLKQTHSKQASKMRAANRIFWPICQDSHWYLIMMDKNKDHSYNVSCLDSLGWGDEEITNKACTVLQALYPDNKKLIKASKCIQVPEQHNLSDCGVSACYWGNQIINLQTLPKDGAGKCDYSQYRFDIAETFVKQTAATHVIVIDDDEEEVKPASFNAIDQLRKKNFR